MTSASHPGGDIPAYRILPHDDPRAVPVSSLGGTVRKMVARSAGRTRLFGSSFDRAYRRLRRNPRARPLPFDFAERHFGDDLLVDVDPARLTEYLADCVIDGERGIRLARWFLDAGDWRGALVPLSASEVDREIAAVLDETTPLTESEAFRFLLAEAERRTPQYRNGVALDRPDVMAAYFDYYRALAGSIRRHGILPRRAVPSELGRRFATDRMRGSGAEARERDIGLAIGPAGELVRMIGGRHRTAIARQLGLPSIPAQIRLVHTRWLRDQVDRTGLPPRKALLDGIRELTAAV